MKLIDVLMTQSMEQCVMIDYLWKDGNGKWHNEKTGIMKVGNIKFSKLRHYCNKTVFRICPCYKHTNNDVFLYIAVENEQGGVTDAV